MTETPEKDTDLKAQLIAKVDKLNAGKSDDEKIVIDKRWSAARIEETIAAAQLEVSEDEAEAVAEAASEYDPAVEVEVKHEPEPEAKVEADEVKSAKTEAEIRAEIEAELKAKYEAEAAEKAKAAFVPAKPPEMPPVSTVTSEPTIPCKVTKFGDQKISTGRPAPDDRYKWGDVVHFPISIAQGLEDKQYVEIGQPQ